MLGALAGIVAGVALGQRTAVLQPFGSAYAMMLQIAVYPYLICVLICGLGRLTPAMARRLLGAGWAVCLFLWGVTLAAIWLLALAIPSTPAPSVLMPATAQGADEFLKLLIPANPIEALGRNYVPATVVFAFVYEIAIQKIERKAALFEVLEAIQAASVTIWGWIVRFAPIGVFALFADAAGTIEPARLSGLLLYVGLFLTGTLLLAFVVLPAVLAAVTPVGHREILKELQPALVIAAVTTLTVVALPFVQRAAERVATEAGCPENEERSNVIRAVLSLSYVLVPLGNYFLYLLMLYGAYAYKVRLTTPEELLLPIWTVLSALGAAERHRRRRDLSRPLAAPAGRPAGSVPRNLDGDPIRPRGVVGDGIQLRHDTDSPGLLPQGAAAAPTGGAGRRDDGRAVRRCGPGRHGAAAAVAASDRQQARGPHPRSPNSPAKSTPPCSARRPRRRPPPATTRH